MPKIPTTKHASNGAVKVKAPPKRESLWKGPTIDGVTQSLLGRFLACPERFRLYAMEGLREPEGFNLRMEYGTAFHLAEEFTLAGKPWQPEVLKYFQAVGKKWPASSAQALHWYNVLMAQYPAYLKHWAKHPDMKNRKPLYQEKSFDVLYRLPSGRSVRLRGKMDAVDVVGKQLYLVENKVKGEVLAEKMLAELPFDLQTMLYLTALSLLELPDWAKKYPIAGTRYNVIRRPLSGGKHSISQRKGAGKAKTGAETEDEFYARLGGLIAEFPEEFFWRWKCEVDSNDLRRFQQRCLNPILEQLVDWWEWIQIDPFDPWGRVDPEFEKYSTHFMFPSGVWNPTLEGRSSPYDSYLQTGSMIGLERTDNLFKELASA